MKYRLIIFFCFIYSSILLAQPVSVDEARQKALEFLSTQSTTANSRSKTYEKTARLKLAHQAPLDKGRYAYYIFNDDANGGYVVISGDDRLPAVLGYSFKGRYDNNNVPSNMRAWLDGYAEQVSYIQSNPDVEIASRKVVQRDIISPMLECTWDQDEPFNRFCPQYVSNRYSTGCVATAMAQLLYYYQWPQQTTQVIPEYTTWSYNIFIPEIPITSIDWGNMLPMYNYDYASDSYDYSDVEAEAVATLMKLCDSSLKMDFKESGSSSSLGIAKNALRDYFDYEEGVILFCEDYELEKWHQIIYDELAEGHPVLYKGDGNSGGHAFIIDGYDNGGFFHVNWGWGGLADGYFQLTSLHPMGYYEFNYAQCAIIGVRPSKPGTLQAYSVLDDKTMTFYYDTEKDNRSGIVYKNVRTCASTSDANECVIDPSFSNFKLWSVEGFFKENETIETIKGLRNMNTEDVVAMWKMFDSCKSLRYIDLDGFNTADVTNMGCMFRNCSSLIELDLSDFVTNKVTNTESMFESCEALKTIYVGDGWNMDNVVNDWWMFVNDFAIRGSKGSGYDYPNYGVEYAHIDGGPNYPGYLSEKVANAYDINGDGKVNGTDIQAVINVIIDEKYVKEADINKDGKVNGTDIQEIVNMIVEEK